jgi:hypothetical protein
MLKRISPMLEETRILPAHQFGFRQNKFTELQEIIRGTSEKKTVLLCGVPVHHTSV